jgi:hypothetical protein
MTSLTSKDIDKSIVVELSLLPGLDKIIISDDSRRQGYNG